MPRFRDRFRTLDVKKALTLVGVALFLLLISFGAYDLKVLVRSGNEFTDLRENNLESSVSIFKVRRGFLELRYDLPKYALESSKERVQTKFREETWKKEIYESFEKYKPTADTQMELDLVRKWGDIYPQYLQQRELFLGLVDAGRMTEADDFQKSTLTPTSIQCLQTLDTLANFLSVEASGKETDFVKNNHQDQLILVAFMICSLAAVAMIIWLAINAIEKALQQKMEVLQKMSALGEIASGIAHEINNPITVINSTTISLQQLLIREPADTARALIMLERVQRSVVRMSKIISGIRAFARDKESDAVTNLSVHQLIEETLAFSTEKIRRFAIALSVDDVPPHLQLQGRQTELSQVLVNLLNNSADAIEQNKEKWIKLNVVDRHDSIEISVTDSGPGIPEHIRKKMFRQSFTTKTAATGTGLGLGICRRIIESHHGSIAVDASCPNTKITIRLPKQQILENAA